MKRGKKAIVKKINLYNNTTQRHLACRGVR